MAANIYRPHLLVIVEDDANRQILNGFKLICTTRQLEVAPLAGGWENVLEVFAHEHIPLLRRFQFRQVLLVIDFDMEIQHRTSLFRALVPAELRDRVFILGSSERPERLVASLGSSKEDIGEQLARDCEHNTHAIWGREMLRHNAEELERMSATVRPILFDSAHG